jgi:hypothetical protein
VLRPKLGPESWGTASELATREKERRAHQEVDFAVNIVQADVRTCCWCAVKKNPLGSLALFQRARGL